MCVRERERQTGRQIETQTDRHSTREKQSDGGTEMIVRSKDSPIKTQ